MSAALAFGRGQLFPGPFFFRSSSRVSPPSGLSLPPPGYSCPRAYSSFLSILTFLSFLSPDLFFHPRSFLSRLST